MALGGKSSMAYWLWSCPASNHGIFIWRFWSHNAKGVWFDHRLIQKNRQYNVWLKSENQGVLMEFSTQKTTATRGQDSMFLQREQLHTYRDGLQPRPKVQSQGLMCLMCVMVWAYVLYMSTCSLFPLLIPYRMYGKNSYKYCTWNHPCDEPFMSI